MAVVLETILLGECGLQKGKPIVAGISGGPDSLCLLGMLQEAGWPVIAAHFDHMLRPEAAAEARAVEAIASRLGVRSVVGKGDVRKYAAEHKQSIETAARELRYQFLFEQAHEQGAQAVAVGHTADDQVETVLMHFLRGAGMNGLKGMPFRTLLREYDAEIPLIRPLLDLWRSDTVAFCESHGFKAHYDASNESVEFTRNRVRHELIPVLETYNLRFREAAWRAGKTLAADHRLLADLLEPVWQRAVLHQTGRYVGLDVGYFCAQPTGVQMHLLGRAVQTLLPGYDTGYADLQRAVDFAGDDKQERTDLVGGLTMLREANVLWLTVDERALPAEQWPQMPAGQDNIRVGMHSFTRLAEGWELHYAVASPGALGPEPWRTADRFHAFLDEAALPGELEVRIRHDGDRFEPLGMDGHSQKLSDYFINAKIPARLRARWPLVCAGDEIVWVPGYAPAHRYRLRAGSTSVVELFVKRPD